VKPRARKRLVRPPTETDAEPDPIDEIDAFIGCTVRPRYDTAGPMTERDALALHIDEGEW
jgi:hypothetical protein